MGLGPPTQTQAEMYKIYIIYFISLSIRSPVSVVSSTSSNVKRKHVLCENRALQISPAPWTQHADSPGALQGAEPWMPMRSYCRGAVRGAELPGAVSTLNIPEFHSKASLILTLHSPATQPNQTTQNDQTTSILWLCRIM